MTEPVADAVKSSTFATLRPASTIVPNAEAVILPVPDAVLEAKTIAPDE